MPPATPADTAPRTAPLATTVATVSLMGILVVGQMYVTIPLMPQIATAWQISQQSAALATTAFALAHAAGSLISGPLSNRWGRRTAMSASTAAMAAVTLLLPLASNLATGITLRAVQGLLAGTFIPMAYAYLNARITPQRLSLALTTVSACMGATVVLGQVQAQLLQALLGWTSVFWLTAPLLLIGAALTRKILLPEPPPAPARPRTTGTSHLLRNRGLLPLYLVILAGAGCLTAVYTGVQLSGPPAVTGSGPAMLTLRAAALPALAAAVLLAPALARRLTPLHRAAAALCTAAAGMAGTALLGGTTTGLAAALFVFMLGFATLGPALVQTIGTRTTGPTQASAIALYGFTLNTGAGIGAQLPTFFNGFTTLAITLALVLVTALMGIRTTAHTPRAAHGT